MDASTNELIGSEIQRLVDIGCQVKMTGPKNRLSPGHYGVWIERPRYLNFGRNLAIAVDFGMTLAEALANATEKFDKLKIEASP